MNNKTAKQLFVKLIEATKAENIEWTAERGHHSIETWVATNEYVTVKIVTHKLFSNVDVRRLEVTRNEMDMTGATYDTIDGKGDEFDALLALVKEVASPYVPPPYVGFPDAKSAIEFLCELDPDIVDLNKVHEETV